MYITSSPANALLQSEEQYLQLLRLLPSGFSSECATEGLKRSLSRATEAVLVRDSSGVVIAFMLYEFVNIGPMWASAWLREGAALIYRSATFVIAALQGQGIGSQLTEFLINKHSPDCFCATSSSINWVRSTERQLVTIGYDVFNQFRADIPEEAFLAAQIALKVTKRDVDQLTRKLVRRNNYSTSEGYSLAASRTDFYSARRNDVDASMLVAFKRTDEV